MTTSEARPTVSVIIPVYNRRERLRRCIKSVLEQTWSDLEVIVVDDGSADCPGEVVESFRDSRVRIISQKNRGAGAARNRGIDSANGRFVAFLDSDDTFNPYHLEKSVAAERASPGVVVYSPVVMDRGDGRTFIKPVRSLQVGEHIATYLLCDRGFVPTSTLLLDRTVAARIRYNESLPFTQDKDFAIRLFAAGNAFIMLQQPGAVVSDVEDPSRVSSGRKGDRIIAWLDDIKPLIPLRAYWGCRGWHIAKGLFHYAPARSLRLYATAVMKGAYSPAFALQILAQIVLRDETYRRLCNLLITGSGSKKVLKQATGGARDDSEMSSRA